MSEDRTIPGCPWAFADDMRKMIDKKEFSDVKFIVGSNRKVIYANKLILCARSSVFRSMLADSHNVKSKNVEPDVPLVLADLAPDVFLSILEFLYTNTCTLTSKNVMDVMGSAIEYGLEHLQKICEHYIGETLSIYTAAEALQTAVTYSQEELQERCVDYIEANTVDVMKTKGFHELSEDSLALLLRSDNLKMDELDLLNAVREWATVNAVVSGRSVAEVAQSVVHHIRLGLLTPEELRQVEQENEKDNFIPVRQFSESWKFHALINSPPHSAAIVRPRRRAGTRPRDT